MTALYRYRELIRNLVVRDLKRKYRDSILGFLWSLANPLCMILVYDFAFKKVLNVPTPNYVPFLIVGLLHWNLFASATIASAGSVRASGGLIKKVAFPLEIIPLSTVLFNVVQYLLAMVVFMPILVFVLHTPLKTCALLFFPLLVLQVLFITGLSMLLSTAAVFYQDVLHFTELAFMFLFWLTPTVYEFSSVPARLKPVVLANPFTPFILAYQEILVYSRPPSLQVLAYAAAGTAVAMVAGSIVFAQYKMSFAEEV